MTPQTIMSESETYYRIESSWTSNGPSLYTHKFWVLRRTPKGAWIVPDYVSRQDLKRADESKRFVRDVANKRYALPTEDEARTSFVARKQRQAKILFNQLSRVKDVLRQVTGKEPVLVRSSPRPLDFYD